MAKYNFKIADDGSTMDSMLKMLSMLQDQDYSVSVNADNHTLTVITEGKRTQNNSVKKTIKTTRCRLFWLKVWRKFCDWYMRKGYWLILIVCLPIMEVAIGHDIISLTEASVIMETWIIVFLISDERRK